MWTRSDRISELAAALVQFQSKVQRAAKTKDNPFFKSKYVDLPTLIEVINPALAEADLAITQLCGNTEGGLPVVTTILMHKSGEWISSDLSLPVEKNTPQGYGSAITYARRYSLASILKVIEDERLDDDGNIHENRQHKPRQTQKPQHRAGSYTGSPDQKKILIKIMTDKGVPADKQTDILVLMEGKTSEKIFGFIDDALKEVVNERSAEQTPPTDSPPPSASEASNNGAT